MNPLEPKMVNEVLSKQMKEALTDPINEELKKGLAGMEANKELFHAVNTAILSNTLEGKEYPVIVLGLAGKIEKGERKELVEHYRNDAHKMWEELFGTQPPPWRADANSKDEPFPFTETFDQFLQFSAQVYKDRIDNLNKDNCRRAAFTMAMMGVMSLIAGSQTVPIIFNGLAWAVWNGDDEILLNSYHDDAKYFWQKYLRDITCPYDL